MRSLFVQLWLAFLAVTAITLGSSLAVSYLSALKRSSDVGTLSPGPIAASAQRVLNAKGPDGIASWALDEVHEHPEVQIYFVDPAGREMFNRRVRGQPVPAAFGHAPPRVRAPDGTIYRVLVQRTRGLVFDFWTILFRPWVLASLILAISGIGCAALAWLMSRPVRKLRQRVRSVAGGELDADLEPALLARKDELGGLARDVQQMVHDLKALIASRELLLRNVSHELRSPLARLRLAADLSERNVGDRGEALQRIGREVERIDGIIGQILYFSRATRPDDLALSAVDLAALLAEVADDARIEADKRQIELRVDCDALPAVMADGAKLRTAIENVLRNAIRHAPDRSPISLGARVLEDEVVLTIADEGAGADGGEEVDWIFAPFRRGEMSDGSGLGLAITRRICELHSGRASARNRPDGGFEVELRLPLGR